MNDIAKTITPYEGRQKAQTRAPAKCHHPQIAALGWSGRGRKPKWVIDVLAAGKTAEDMAIG